MAAIKPESGFANLQDEEQFRAARVQGSDNLAQDAKALDQAPEESAPREDTAAAEARTLNGGYGYESKKNSSDVEKANGKGLGGGGGMGVATDVSSGHGSMEKEVVLFEDGDPMNPRNWPLWKKWTITIFVSWLNVCCASLASAYSTGSTGVQEDFGVSGELATAGLSLYVLGFAIGPMLVAPLSEIFGRKPVYVVCWFFFVLLNFGVAFAPNIEAVLICRFLVGLAASPPLANTGGVISDLWARDVSGPPMSVYGLSSTIGPPMGNIWAGFISQQKGWRWVFYIAILVFGVHFFIILFLLPETRHNIILQRKASKLRKGTGDSHLVSAHQEERQSFSALWKVSLTRPFRFLLTEPITLFSALYNGFLFGLIFLFNEAFVLVFGPENHGYAWQHPGVVQLTFATIVVGSFIGFALHPVQGAIYQRQLRKNGGRSVPEARMALALIGTFLLPIGLFEFAWTCYPSIPWIVPCIGATIFGIGFYFILTGILCFVVDSYGQYSASALGGVVLVRNLFGAGFPLFATYMYENLGNHWATSLIAFLSILLIPIPYLFFFRGRAIRLKSPYAREHFDDDEDKPH